MTKSLTLILGGVRSGKSRFAQQIASPAKRVLFLATAEAGDSDMAARIQNHKDARPKHWDTLEEPLDLVPSLAAVMNDYDVVILECLTLWVSNLMLSPSVGDDAVPHIPSRVRELLNLFKSGTPSLIVVSNEVGLGVVPATTLGRSYADELGRVNQIVAAEADVVYFMAAGLPLQIKG